MNMEIVEALDTLKIDSTVLIYIVKELKVGLSPGPGGIYPTI